MWVIWIWTIFSFEDQGAPRRVELKISIPVDIYRLIVIFLSQTAASSLNYELVDDIYDVAWEEKDHLGEETDYFLNDERYYEDQVEGFNYEGTDVTEVKLDEK